jgi:hypothetical protein
MPAIRKHNLQGWLQTPTLRSESVILKPDKPALNRLRREGATPTPTAGIGLSL